MATVKRRAGISSAPLTITHFVAPMAELMETSASSATQFRKYGAHHAAMKPEELEHTYIRAAAGVEALELPLAPQ